MCLVYLGYNFSCTRSGCENQGFFFLDRTKVTKHVNNREVHHGDEFMSRCSCRDELYISCTSQYEQADRLPYRRLCHKPECHHSDQPSVPSSRPRMGVRVVQSSTHAPLEIHRASDQLMLDLLERLSRPAAGPGPLELDQLPDRLTYDLDDQISHSVDTKEQILSDLSTILTLRYRHQCDDLRQELIDASRTGDSQLRNDAE